jgi:hypothetical protein
MSRRRRGLALADQLEHLARRLRNLRTGSEDRFDAGFLEERIVARRDDAADGDDDVAGAELLQLLDELGTRVLWPPDWVEMPTTCTSFRRLARDLPGRLERVPTSTSKPRSANAVAITLAPRS